MVIDDKIAALKLECLRLAREACSPEHRSTGEVLSAAEEFWAFISDTKKTVTFEKGAVEDVQKLQEDFNVVEYRKGFELRVVNG